MYRLSEGITLIALVITIIILIILAGVSINLLMGSDGIIEKANKGSSEYKEGSAKEKLEMEFSNLLIQKVENKKQYNDEFVDNYLLEKGYIVNGNIVTVDGWQFQVDKSVPKIVASLGKGQEIAMIDLQTDIEYAQDYSKATLKIEIIYEGNIKQIKIDGQELEVPTKIDNKYEIEQEILENRNFTIYLIDENDNYKLVTVSCTEIVADMQILNIEQLKNFRDRVNSGITYEGKTITLSKNIDLNENKYEVDENGVITFYETAEQWIPIGTEEHPFKGTFDGNGFSIKGIYINDETKNIQGFIGQNTGGTIKNLTIENGSIVAGYYIGGVAGINTSGTINNVVNKINVESKQKDASGQSFVGGIVGKAEFGIVKNSVNYGNVKSVGCHVGGIIGYAEDLEEDILKCANVSEYVMTTGSNSTNYTYVAGIVGYLDNSNIYRCYNTSDVTGANGNMGGIAGNAIGTIIECYNTGKVESKGTNKSGYNSVGGIAGWAGNTISDCYNTGDVIGTQKMVGGIAGTNGQTDLTIKREIKNCYNTGNVSKGNGEQTGVYFGGIGGNVGSTVSNSYYLTGTSPYGTGNTSSTGSNTYAIPKASAELMTLASTLGTAFVEDENGGYPLLVWQAEE